MLQVVVERHVAANVGQQVRVALLPQHATQRLAEPARLEELEGRTVEGALLLLGGTDPRVCAREVVAYTCWSRDRVRATREEVRDRRTLVSVRVGVRVRDRRTLVGL